MDGLLLLATVLVAGAISAVAIAYVVRPLLAQGPAPLVLEDDKLSDLLWRKDAAIKAIKDLEFDYRVGKVSDEDYRQLDERLRRQAIVLIQQLDKVAPQSSTLDDQLEATIARMRKVQAPAPESAKSAAPLPAVQPANGSHAARYCTNCGHLLDPSHRFCANCGTPVAAPALVSGDGAAV